MMENDDLREGLNLDGAEPAYDWSWQDLTAFANIPAPVHLVNGLLIGGNVTLWYARVKEGKSRLLFGMLKSLAPDGPPFLGMDLPDLPALLFTEEPPNVVGERVRDYGIPAMHLANMAPALAMKPDDFAETVWREYQANGAGFGLIAIDTIGTFVNVQDWNNYPDVKAAMAPIRQLAHGLPDVALLLLHHQNKTGSGSDWNGALGSTALPANADQLVRMSRTSNGRHTITVGGRHKPEPFPFDEPVTISISADRVELIGTAADAAGDLLTEHLGPEPLTIKAIEEAMGDDAPGRKAIDKALAQMVKEGRAVKTPGSGNRGATYQTNDS